MALVVVLGAYLLVIGVSEIGWALRDRRAPGWGLLLARGIVNTVAGIVVLAWPAATALVLALLLAAWLFVYAVLTLSYAYRHRNQRPHSGHFALKGGAALVAAVITVAWPGITALVLALIIGVELVVTGAVLVRLALNLRRAGAA